MLRVWRQWRATAAMAVTSPFGEGPLFAIGYLLRVLRLAVLLALWQVILGSGGNAGDSPMSLESVLTYTLIASVFAPQLDVQTLLPGAFWEGTIAGHFTRPMGIVSQFAAPLLGEWLLDVVLYMIPVLVVASLLGVSPAPADGWALLWFVASLALAVVVGLAIEFLFTSITVALEQPIWLIEFVRRAIQAVLTGAVIPLALLPWGLGELLEWLPFAAMAWAPLAIYTGAGEPAPLLAMQLFWALALWPLAMGLWNANREKVVGYGG